MPQVMSDLPVMANVSSHLHDGAVQQGDYSTGLSLTDKELIEIAESRRTATGRMNWERTIFPEWRRLHVPQAHCQYLKRHMENEVQKKKKKNPSTTTEMGTGFEQTPTSPPRNLFDGHQRRQSQQPLPSLLDAQVSDDVVENTNLLRPTQEHIEPTREEEQVEELPQPNVGQAFSTAENDLFNHLMTDPDAQRRIRTVNRGRKKLTCWKTVERMWIEEAAKRNREAEGDNQQLFLRTAKQLKQRHKDM